MERPRLRTQEASKAAQVWLMCLRGHRSSLPTEELEKLDAHAFIKAHTGPIHCDGQQTTERSLTCRDNHQPPQGGLGNFPSHPMGR